MCSAVSAEDTVSSSKLDTPLLNDVYVSPSGNDTTGNGSQTNPYQTIGIGIQHVTDNGNGVVHLAEGTYNNSKDSDIDIYKNVTILGAGKDKSIIDALGLDEIFNVDYGYSLIIKDLTLKNSSGSAIYNSGTLTVINCDFVNNFAKSGGAIYNEGILSVTGSTFINNQAGSGGAIYCREEIANISDCTFTRNVANNGGAIYLRYGETTITGSTFLNNTAAYGGAIYNYEAFLNLTNSRIENNTAQGIVQLLGEGTSSNQYGGGIFLNKNSMYKIISNHILNNVGSGIYIGRVQLQEESSVYTTDISNFYKLINFNRIYGNTPYGIFYENFVSQTGELSASTPKVTINATLNWWGSNGGPNSPGADKTNLNSTYYAPWIVMQFITTQMIMNGGQTVPLVANFLYDNLGNYHDPVYGHVPDGIPVLFTTNLGQVGSQSIIKNTINGIATAILKAWNASGAPVWGIALVTASVDGQTALSSSVTIQKVASANTAELTGKTIGMQNTGLPIPMMILAILMVIGGLTGARRK